MKLSTYIQSNHDKVLVMGLPGTGKSTLAAELAKQFHVIWIDCEHGVKTLMKLPPEVQENIDLISLPDSANYPIAAATLVELFKKGKGNICWEHGKIDCGICSKGAPDNFTSIDFSKLTSNDIVVLDTITQLGASVLAHITRSITIETKLDWDTWGVLRRQTEFIASQIQSFDFNFVCIAHLTEGKLEDGKVKLVPQFGSSVMSGTFAKAFDHVIYCDIINGKHVAGSSTGYKNNILTKSRTDFCIEDLPSPSLIPLFSHTFTPRTGAGSPKVTTPSAPSPATNAVSSLKDLLNKGKAHP